MEMKSGANKSDKLTVSCFSCGNFSQIPVVIAFHFKVEYLTFWITSFWNQIFVQKTLHCVCTDSITWNDIEFVIRYSLAS